MVWKRPRSKSSPTAATRSSACGFSPRRWGCWCSDSGFRARFSPRYRDAMRFEQPSFLYLLILIPLFGLMAWVIINARRKKLRAFISADLQPGLLLGVSAGRSAGRACLRIAGIAMFILALARPQWGHKDEPVVRRGV